MDPQHLFPNGLISQAKWVIKDHISLSCTITRVANQMIFIKKPLQPRSTCLLWPTLKVVSRVVHDLCHFDAQITVSSKLCERQCDFLCNVGTKFPAVMKCGAMIATSYNNCLHSPLPLPTPQLGDQWGNTHINYTIRKHPRPCTPHQPHLSWEKAEASWYPGERGWGG